MYTHEFIHINEGKTLSILSVCEILTDSTSILLILVNWSLVGIDLMKDLHGLH